MKLVINPTVLFVLVVPAFAQPPSKVGGPPGLQSAPDRPDSVLRRDIMIAADLSGSYNDDSLLQRHDVNDANGGINLLEVWRTLPNSSANGALLDAWLAQHPRLGILDAPEEFFQLQPGFFSRLGADGAGSVAGVGTAVVDSAYDPTQDDGLVYLPSAHQWQSDLLGKIRYSKLRAYLLKNGYSDAEVRLIMADKSPFDAQICAADMNFVSFNSEYGDRRRYDLRATVALGLMYWSSGVAGGLWEARGWAPGNGDYRIDASERVDSIAYPYPEGNWLEYSSYMRDANNSSSAYDSLPGIKYRFGPKTLVNFLLEEKELHAETDVAHFAFANPLHITKNAIAAFASELIAAAHDDRLGLVTFGTSAVLEYPLPPPSVGLPQNATDVEHTYRRRQAAHYSPATNIGQAIDFAAAELDPATGINPRASAAKHIILMTDGLPNIDQDGNMSSTGGAEYALQAAQTACTRLGATTTIHVIGVGSAVDMDLLNQIAGACGAPQAYHADGDWDAMRAALESALIGIVHSDP